MNHKGLAVTATATAAALLLAGCGSSATTSERPTSESSSNSAQPTVSPTSKAIVTVPDVQVLAPQNGYVFVAMKTGKTRCQINATQVGCESDFANAPQITGETATGVRVGPDGKLRWALGNLGSIPTVPLDYRTYSAVGWNIASTPEGTRFTNQSSGHGMAISTSGVQGF